MAFVEGVYLGQAPIDREVALLAQGQQVDAGLMQEAQSQYDDIRSWCAERFGAQFCNTVMPQNVLYAMERRAEGLPWWAWLGIGFVVAKIMRF